MIAEYFSLKAFFLRYKSSYTPVYPEALMIIHEALLPASNSLSDNHQFLNFQGIVGYLNKCEIWMGFGSSSNHQLNSTVPIYHDSPMWTLLNNGDSYTADCSRVCPPN